MVAKSACQIRGVVAALLLLRRLFSSSSSTSNLGSSHGGASSTRACVWGGGGGAPTRVFFPTSQAKPLWSGSRISDQFNRPKPDKFKFQIKIRSSVGLVRYTGPVRPVPGRLAQITEVVENLTCFQIWIKNWKNKKKFHNIARCIESNGVKTFQILVHLIFFAGIRSSTDQFFSPFLFYLL
jgi:hypothetical protein